MTAEQTATATATATVSLARTAPPVAGSATGPVVPLVPARDDFTFTAPPAHRTPTRAAAPARGSTALPRLATAVAVVVLTGFLLLIVSGRVVTEGPVVLVLTRTHGVHLGDLFALGAWCLAVGALLASVLAGAPLRRRRPPAGPQIQEANHIRARQAS